MFNLRQDGEPVEARYSQLENESDKVVPLSSMLAKLMDVARCHSLIYPVMDRALSWPGCFDVAASSI
jgi:hypothetical protein